MSQLYEQVSEIATGGMVREDVMDKIFDVSKIPLPFTDRIGRSTHGNRYFEWAIDRLAAPSTANAQSEDLDAETAGGADDSAEPTYGRIGNHSQISSKTLHVSERAKYASTIGFRNAMAYQLMMRGNELRRDIEAMALQNRSSNADDPSGASVGTTAGLEAWVADEDERGTVIYNATGGNASQYRDISTGGIGIGGWPNRTGTEITDIDYSSVTAVTAVAEQDIRDVVQAIYERGWSETTNLVLMARPSMIRKISEYMFTSSARISTLTNMGSDEVSKRVAQGAVNVFLTDFGVLEMVPNRLMQQSNRTGADGDSTPLCDSILIFDPTYLSLSFMQGYTTLQLARDGLQDKRMIYADWGLRVNNWCAVGGIFGADATAAVTAT